MSAKIGAVPAQVASSWLNPKLIVRESRIAGLGLFAIAPVERGEECCHLAGELMTDERFRVHVASRARYSALAVDERLNLVQSDDDPATKGNHSCDPNMWLADTLTVVARRPIAAGDEATIDYASLTVEATWSMECKCGSPLCREIVTGDDWRLPELRARYGGHWSPFIERRIRAEGQSAQLPISGAVVLCSRASRQGVRGSGNLCELERAAEPTVGGSGVPDDPATLGLVWGNRRRRSLDHGAG